MVFGPGPTSRVGLPASYIPLRALLSAILVALVSGFVLVTTQGNQPGSAAWWVQGCLTTWPVAFVAVTVVAPWVRRVVGRLTQPA